MRTTTRHLRPLLLVLVSAVLVLSACSGGDEEGDGESGGGEATSESGGGEATGDEVAIVDFTFDPAGLTVPAGTTVTFTNEDSAPHTATADDDSFDTGDLEEGDTAEVTFDEPGEVPYFCNIHNYMRGTVTVE